VDLLPTAGMSLIFMGIATGFGTALATGPLAQELSGVLREMRIGAGRPAATRSLAARTEVPELRSFVRAVAQAGSFGVPAATVLRVQSREMRVRWSRLAEERARKVPVKILFPLVFCILPSLFIVVIGPAGITMLQNLRVP